MRRRDAVRPSQVVLAVLAAFSNPLDGAGTAAAAMSASASVLPARRSHSPCSPPRWAAVLKKHSQDVTLAILLFPCNQRLGDTLSCTQALDYQPWFLQRGPVLPSGL